MTVAERLVDGLGDARTALGEEVVIAESPRTLVPGCRGKLMGLLWGSGAAAQAVGWCPWPQ